MSNNVPPIKRINTKKKNGCLRTVLISFGVGFILVFGGGVYLYDQISGNAAKRFEEKENKKIKKETLPDEYKSYQYLSDLESTDEYEITPMSLNDRRLYYYLPDKTLIIAGSSLSYGKGFVYKISPNGEIVDSYYGTGLSFCGSSLIREYIFYPPQISSDDDTDSDIKIIVRPDPVIKTFYSNWPVNGDTTFYPMQMISEIATAKTDLHDAYEKADVVKTLYLSGEIDGARTMLHIDDVWYISEYLKDKPEKSIHSIKEDYERNLKDLDVKVQYKKYTGYYRARSAGWLSGGMLNYAHWEGDAYLSLKIGNIIIPFKKRFEETRRNQWTSAKVSMDIMNRGTYAIVDSYLIRPKIVN